jgi:uncharacterized iron-regulated membrane protein
MKNSFRQSMTWLHTWSGLLLGWVAYAVFVTGTASYFKPEIGRWMQPELAGHAAPIEAARAAVRMLETRAAQASRWFIDVPDGRSHELHVFWQPAGGGRFQNERLDSTTGAKSTARATLGGEFFYRFHFQLQLPHPWGRYAVGVVALAMFVALLTGIVAHRRFFADLFLFRPGRVVLRSWLDFHNVAGVLTLPFFLMISYSGLVIFNALYLPWPGKVLPLEDKHTAVASAKSDSASGWIAPASLKPMLDEAARRWGNERSLRRIDVIDRGTARAVVTLTRNDRDTVSIRSRDQLKFDGISGQLFDDAPLSTTDGPGRAVHGVLYGLHMARFADPFLRTLLFSLGVLGSALIASGLVMWTLKRRVKLASASAGERLGFWLVERLNLTAIVGLLLASAGFFWANRLLPVDLTTRAEREVLCFLIVWGASLLHACIRPPLSAWREQLLAAAALFILLPVLDFFTAGNHLRAAGRAWDFAYLGFEFVAIAIGIFLAIAAGKVGRRIAGGPEGPAKSSPATSPVTERTPQEVAS